MASTFKVESNVIRFMERVDKIVARRLLDACLLIQQQLQDDLRKKKFPPKSQPGQYPAMRTGKLANNVIVFPISIASIMKKRMCSVGYRKTSKPSPAKYGAILVARGRRGPADTFRKNLSVIRAIMNGTSRGGKTR